MKIINYFLRDKIDLVWLAVYVLLLVLYLVNKDDIILLASSLWGFIWGTGAIIRMGIFNEMINNSK